MDWPDQQGYRHRFHKKTITTHKIDPDIDETREFLLEDLAFAQAVKRFGYAGGVGSVPCEQPRDNLTGDPYFTDGRRVVMWVTGEPVALDEIEVLDFSLHHTGVIGNRMSALGKSRRSPFVM